jgi:large subunit ribosomal protein L25
MSRYTLLGSIRTIVGKKVQSLRESNQLPATVYGKTTKPVTITISLSDFKKLFKEAGETGLIELTIDKQIHPVLIHMVQLHPVTQAILHVEFHEVDLKVKVHAEVPVECVGVPQAVNDRLGVLLTLIDHIEVEALPTNLPEKITIDITHLAAVDEQITVQNLVVPSDVTVLTDPTVIVAKIGAFIVEKEPEPVVPAEGAETPTPEGEVKEGVEEAPVTPAKEPPQEK